MYIPKMEPGPGDCRFNAGVICSSPVEKCRKCGWNPLVDSIRKMETRDKMNMARPKQGG